MACMCVGQIRVSADVAVVSYLHTADSHVPMLVGQADGFTSASGIANISGLILRASPGVYKIFLSLPDYPQVRYAKR